VVFNQSPMSHRLRSFARAPGGLPGLGLRLLRWAATLVALGSLAAAGIDWSLGLGAWDLVLAALGAGTVAAGLFRWERRWRGATWFGYDRPRRSA